MSALIQTILVLTLIVFGLHRLFLVMTVWGQKKTHTGSGSEDLVENRQGQHGVSVLVQIPIYNEPHVVLRIIQSVTKLEYPKEHLSIQILDDSSDETSAIIDEFMEKQDGSLDIKVIRRTQRTGFKAGALQHGLNGSTHEFVAIFDADFTPPSNFLTNCLPYFEDPKIGMVQARWTYRNRDASALTRAQAILLDGHFRIEQYARSLRGLWFNFNGTAGIWRRRCIDDSGGWSGQTLTEDLDLSYRAQMKGWQFSYLDDVQVPSELPDELNAFFTQQFRWAKGSIQVARKLLGSIWASNARRSHKIEASIHLLANINYPLIAILTMSVVSSMLLSEVMPAHGAIVSTLFLAASACFSTFYIASQSKNSSLIHTLRTLPIVFALGIGLCVNNSRACLEALFAHESPFIRTPKTGDKYGFSGRQTTLIGRYKQYPIECTATLFSSIALVNACIDGYWSYCPFLLLLTAGLSAPIWLGRKSKKDKSVADPHSVT